MYKLVDETGLAANIGVLEGGRVLLVDRVESPESIAAAVPLPRELRDIGIDLPAHTTGLGKVLLAWLDHGQVLKIIKEQGLPRKTATTIVSTADLLAELELVRACRYATVKDEHYTGFWSIAVPILDVNGLARAAVSLTGSPDRPVWRDPDSLAIRLTEAAREISRSMRLR